MSPRRFTQAVLEFTFNYPLWETFTDQFTSTPWDRSDLKTTQWSWMNDVEVAALYYGSGPTGNWSLINQVMLQEHTNPQPWNPPTCGTARSGDWSKDDAVVGSMIILLRDWPVHP